MEGRCTGRYKGLKIVHVTEIHLHVCTYRMVKVNIFGILNKWTIHRFDSRIVHVLLSTWHTILHAYTVHQELLSTYIYVTVCTCSFDRI